MLSKVQHAPISYITSLSLKWWSGDWTRHAEVTCNRGKGSSSKINRNIWFKSNNLARIDLSNLSLTLLLWVPSCPIRANTLPNELSNQGQHTSQWVVQSGPTHFPVSCPTKPSFIALLFVKFCAYDHPHSPLTVQALNFFARCVMKNAMWRGVYTRAKANSLLTRQIRVFKARNSKVLIVCLW